METRPVATRLRGVWIGVTDFDRSRTFYERIGGRFERPEPVDGILYATLGGTRLVLEAGSGSPSGEGSVLLFDVTDADALHADLEQHGCRVEGPPKDEPWGRQFNVRDPDGHLIAFIGPAR